LATLPKIVQPKRSGKKGGKKNMNKSRQPKRQRYVASKRGYNRRIKSLKNHIVQNPHDAGAPEALERLAIEWGMTL